jgi:uncharacterized phage protein gp47/JayE
MTDNYPTRDEYFQIGAAEIISRSKSRPERERLSRASVFTDGTDINIICAASAAMADEATRQISARMAQLYLSSAEEQFLDRLVADRISATLGRKLAGPASVTLQFSRAIPPSAGAAITMPQGSKFRTAQGTEFALSEAVSFSVGSTGPVTGGAQAVLAGPGGNAATGTITQFSGASPDAAIRVTNTEPGAGGRADELDEDYRERARAFFATASRGTGPAIEAGAKTVPGVRDATTFEELDITLGVPTGRVSLAIADAQGQANSALTTRVRSVLRDYRCLGVVVDVLASTPAQQSIAYQGISFVSGTDTVAAVQQLKALTVAAVNVLQPGQTLPVALLFSIASSIPGAVVPGTAVVMPAGDVLVNTNQVIKTSLSAVTVNGL